MPLKTPRTTVRRLPKRGHNDFDTIAAILDAGFLCNLGFVANGQPYVIPTGYGRDGRVLYVHGSALSRTLRTLAEGVPLCLTVTHIDGLVLARSGFHSSMNYRSVVVLGTARLVTGEEKLHALEVISEQILPGRWAEIRLHSQGAQRHHGARPSHRGSPCQGSHRPASRQKPTMRCPCGRACCPFP
jgi:nitroimidazol reductase NimA-like FMN-containing flavoprotein (pyridoxamine 5'-phosphate oxidase superfamily)